MNQPLTPGLIPKFRSFNDLTDKMEQVLESRFLPAGVTVDFTYVPEVSSPYEAARFEVDLGFATDFNVSAGLDASFGLGDLADVTVADAYINATGAASFKANFGVILGANDDEELVLIGNSCYGKNFTCAAPTSAYKVNLTYTFLNGTEVFKTLTLTGNGTSTPATVLNDTLKAATGTDVRMETQGTALLVIRFNSTIQNYTLTVPKINTTAIATVYGFTDSVLSKKKFQMAIGTVSAEGRINVTGGADIAANVGGVIAVNSSLGAALSGSVNVSVGDDFIPAGDWIVALTKIFGDASTEGYRAGFLTANASFDGNFSASVQALKPFDFARVNATGQFLEPFAIDFLNVNASKLRPNVTFVVDLPKIGNLRDMTFKDVIEPLQLALEFLVGADDGDSVETCSGGLLGLEIGGSSVFTYQIPGK